MLFGLHFLVQTNTLDMKLPKKTDSTKDKLWTLFLCSFNYNKKAQISIAAFSSYNL